MTKPATLYTKSGRINIAYQVFGNGKIDLVYIPGWVSNIDLMWECPELVKFLQDLGKIFRVVLFDKRGTGLSDRIIELSTLEERMDDIRAVMDAVDSEKAVLFGHSEGGSVSALYAATYPNRTISLITFGIFAKRKYAPHYPWAPTDEERQVVYDMIENNWGSGKMNLETLAPSKANDKDFMNWLANYFRSGASPSAALVLTKMNTQVDIIDILDSIKVPTLIMQRTHDIDVKIEEGRFIASKIEGAHFVELDGYDHLFWIGNTDEVLNEIKTFIDNINPLSHYEKQLVTIIIGKISSPNGSYDCQDQISEYVEQYRGKLVFSELDTFIATFEGPSKAVHCALDLLDNCKNKYGLKIGIHIKECIISNFNSGESQELAKIMLQNIRGNQIIITQTVKNLMVGAGVDILPYRMSFFPTSGDYMMLYHVLYKTDEIPSSVVPAKISSPNNGSFLEKVLQSIEDNLDNEAFSVEILSSEIGMSERQLQRKLKAITNKSPNQLISSVRLHRAKEWLMTQSHNVSEIAYKTGFANPSYFSKAFKKEFGISPSDIKS